MDKNPTNVQKIGKDGDFPIPPEYQLYMDERMTKKKKKMLVRSGPRSGSPFAAPTFEMPTSDKNGRFLSPPSESVKKEQKYPPGQYGHPTEPIWTTYSPQETSAHYQPSSSKHVSNKLVKVDPDEQNVDYQPNRILTVSSKYESNRPKPPNNDKLEYRGSVKPNHREQNKNQASYSQPMYTNFKQSPKPPDRSEPSQFNLDENPSLICRAVNYEGEPVKVNDEVIEDKLILSCRPRTFYGLGGYSKKPPIVTSDRDPFYPSAPPQINNVDGINRKRPTDVDIRQQYEGKFDERDYPEKGTGPLERHDAVDIGTLGLGDGGLEQTSLQAQAAKYEEQYRIMQCKKYMRNFRGFLWALFIINILLLVTGVLIMIICMYHLIFHDYINTVLMYTGFVIWVWVALALSLFIIVVALCGIVTAVTRRKRMIRFWIIWAIVTIILICVFLLVYWLMHSDMQELQEISMDKAFHLYRCKRLVRHAWDTLHEQYQCCGIKNSADWKYIPPSCCQADTIYSKLNCINHFIQYDLAYKNGCRGLLEKYFTKFFLLLTVLLVLAIILLFLGIVVAWRLLKMYKVILLCRDTYSITS